jgi:hypothetical protein
VAQRDHHAPGGHDVGVHDGRDAVQRVEEKVRLHLRPQRCQFRACELGGELRGGALTPCGQLPVVPGQRSGDEYDVNEQIHRKESDHVQLDMLHHRDARAVEPGERAQASGEHAV